MDWPQIWRTSGYFWQRGRCVSVCEGLTEPALVARVAGGVCVG